MKMMYGLIALVMLLGGCVSVEIEKTTDLRAEHVMLAKTGSEGQVDEAAPDSFRAGDEVSIVFLNVAGLQKGDDGLYKYDLDMELKDSAGKVIYTQKDLIGEAGHRALEGGIAKSPAGTITTNEKTPKGTYTFTVTLKDKISGKSIAESREFTLK